MCSQLQYDFGLDIDLHTIPLKWLYNPIWMTVKHKYKWEFELREKQTEQMLLALAVDFIGCKMIIIR